jgi:hypothetical protein
MGGSIHIHGTGSSIIDTVFVCRTPGHNRPGQICAGPADLLQLVQEELVLLRSAGVKPTAGDIRCIVFGHLTRIAIQQLRDGWDATAPTAQRLLCVAAVVNTFADPQVLIDTLVQQPQADTWMAGSLFSQDLPDAVSV